VLHARAALRGAAHADADPEAPRGARREGRTGHARHVRREAAAAGRDAHLSTSLHDRVCLVTGATSGIGRATAFELARRGATLGLVARDRGRGEETLAAIRGETGSDRVRLFLADLSVQADIRRVAAELLAAYPAIHVLVNNAGVVNLRYSTTADGIETVFAVNHLAYFLLTNLLLARLRASAPARIVNVASEVHRIGKIDFDDLGHEHAYKTMRVYGTSKLANLLFTYELARRLDGTGVTVNAVHPGAVATRLGQNNGRIATLLTRFLAPFFRSPERGAETSILLATAPELAAVSGRYFVNRREARSSRASHDAAAARRLWDVSAAMTGLAAPVD
jgi:NAD(P)-dependent dehydrogenase (short-subunit alcohol dehydrogenase family)